ncbi:MAG: hypothetical protein ACK5WR_03485, partial [Planctomycetaceae bacterium]
MTVLPLPASPTEDSPTVLWWRKFNRVRSWLWPCLAAMVLLGLGLWIRTALDRVLSRSVAEQLTTVRDANVEALQIWLKNQKHSCQLAAESRRVQSAAVEVLESFRTQPPGAPPA